MGCLPTGDIADLGQIHPRSYLEWGPFHLCFGAADMSALGMEPASLPRLYPIADRRLGRGGFDIRDRCAQAQQRYYHPPMLRKCRPESRDATPARYPGSSLQVSWVYKPIADGGYMVIQKRCFAIAYTRVPAIATPLSLFFYLDP